MLLLLILEAILIKHCISIQGAWAEPGPGPGHHSLALPNCQDKCGNISIPYPFGIGRGCFLDTDGRSPFEVRCNNDGAYVNINYWWYQNFNDTLLEINVLHGEARVRIGWSIAWSCNYGEKSNFSRLVSEEKFVRQSLGNFMKLSTKNKLTAVGCATIATIVGSGSTESNIFYNKGSRFYTSTCASLCGTKDSISTSTKCDGMGCCQTSIPQNLTTYSFAFANISVTKNVDDDQKNADDVKRFSPCSYAFFVEENWFTFNTSYAISNNFQSLNGLLPLVLDWNVGTETCEEAKKNKSSYACTAKNSECVPARSGLGYLCNCSQGFMGNPYLGGCLQDINECDYSPSLYPCYGICTNTIGNYICSCPAGTQSKDPKNAPCTPIPESNRRQVKVVIGTSISFVVLIVCVSTLLIQRQKWQLAKEKQRFFKQNGGHILYQQILSKKIDTVIIFTIEDLKRATNNYDKSRLLGTGGHGTVYKGILEDNKLVAVKRSKTMNVSQNEDFVQEIIILSQINHKNVVRLIGCCLEVEVPILVYEFITNGTLFHLIHDNHNIQHVSLDVRLKIAQESAEALAYMHLTMNRPIVHADVKSLNILLDENYMAKVSDFGASRLLPKEEAEFMTMVQGTLGYLDPEYLQERILTEKSDVYSFGVVLLELITRKTAIYSEGPNKERKGLAASFLLAMTENRVEDILDTSIMSAGMEELFQEVAELASMCLSFKGEERPSMTQVADKLKAIRSTWREILLLKHEETQRLIRIERLPPSMSYTAQMLGLDIETATTCHTGTTSMG
ncbi:unnamed protein product [Urochloa decumbens]|uniref:Protein kinase domain-containing protein n=1 Tax=Urochloa decumbens TaxID=240449 RepID=A0ABC9DC81_9POAL